MSGFPKVNQTETDDEFGDELDRFDFIGLVFSQREITVTKNKKCDLLLNIKWKLTKIAKKYGEVKKEENMKKTLLGIKIQENSKINTIEKKRIEMVQGVGEEHIHEAQILPWGVPQCRNNKKTNIQNYWEGIVK